LFGAGAETNLGQVPACPVKRDIPVFSSWIGVYPQKALIRQIAQVFSEAVGIAVIDVLLQGIGSNCAEGANIPKHSFLPRTQVVILSAEVIDGLALLGPRTGTVELRNSLSAFLVVPFSAGCTSIK
jgi:hypothetical protein